MRTTTVRSLSAGTLGLAVTIATVATSRGLAGHGTPTFVENALRSDFPTIVDTSVTPSGRFLLSSPSAGIAAREAGRITAEIASRLHVADVTVTVSTHITAIIRKLQVENRDGALRLLRGEAI